MLRDVEESLCKPRLQREVDRLTGGNTGEEMSYRNGTQGMGCRVDRQEKKYRRDEGVMDIRVEVSKRRGAEGVQGQAGVQERETRGERGGEQAGK